MTQHILIEVFLAAGVIAGLWKLNWTVASMAKELKYIISSVKDHEARLRNLEDK